MPARTAQYAPNVFPFSREFVIEATGGCIVWQPERDCRVTHLAFLSEEPDVMLELVPSYPLAETRRLSTPESPQGGRVYIPAIAAQTVVVGRQRVVTRFSSKHLGVLWPHSMQLPVPLLLLSKQEFIVRGPRGIAVVYGEETPDWSQGREEES